MNFVEKLITYCETQNFTDLNLTNCVDQENLNVIVIEILSWLRLQRKREQWIEQRRKAKLKPMALNMKYAWCSEFVSYVYQDNIFWRLSMRTK